jgi:hypothetical protein
MMMYVTRSDGSLWITLPGEHTSGHYSHIPFLMARAGSRIANALGMAVLPGVVAGAFDDRLTDALPGSFAYRCLDGADLEVISRDVDTLVDHRATHLAQMNRIAAGKRVRGDLRRWSRTSVTVSGGRLDNSAAHPDAGKIWSFGDHQQPLTDATLYRTPSAYLRLSVGREVFALDADETKPAELWVVSAAGPNTSTPNPKRLEHSLMLFEFFSEATPVIATCEEAEGRVTLATEYPSCSTPALASRAGGASRLAPPFVELCTGGGCCD